MSDGMSDAEDYMRWRRDFEKKHALKYVLVPHGIWIDETGKAVEWGETYRPPGPESGSYQRGLDHAAASGLFDSATEALSAIPKKG
jgi:hypothetical protein